MSKIKSLSIKGIRSFGPGTAQKIEFEQPLTLILGQNGTGKTTLIECLKFATTGEMPPNARGSKGGAFVHDLEQIACLDSVTGQVTLELDDVTGTSLRVQRSIKALKEQGKKGVRKVDNSIWRMEPDGQLTSITRRIRDYDNEMVAAMGVSKSILNDVIFCHQEDSCWPLSEGRALKDKFDAIFASTRYTQALEEIRKIKKRQELNMTLFQNDLENLTQLKESASKLKADLNDLQEKDKIAEARKTTVNESFLQTSAELQSNTALWNIINEVEKALEGQQKEKGQLEKYIQELENNIENVFQGPKEELEHLLNDQSEVTLQEQDMPPESFQELEVKIAQKENERRQLETHWKKLNTEIDKMHKDMQFAATNQLEKMQMDRARKEDVVKTILAQHESSLLLLLKSNSTSDVCARLEEFITHQSEVTKQFCVELQETETILACRETESGILKKQIKQTEDKLRALKVRIEEACKGQNFIHAMQNVQQKMFEVQNKHGSLLASNQFLKEYIIGIQNQNSCPLCHRAFSSDYEAQELITELEGKVRMMESHMLEAVVNVSRQQVHYEDMIELKSDKENLLNIQQHILPGLFKQLQEVEDDAFSLKKIFEKKCEVLENEKKKEALARKIQPDIWMVEFYQQEIKLLDKRIVDQSSILSSDGSCLDDVRKEARATMLQLDSLKNSVSDLQRQKSNHPFEVRALQNKIRKRELLDNLQLLEKQADLKTMMEQIVDMTNQLNDLNPGKVKQEQATLIKRASDLNNQLFQIKGEQAANQSQIQQWTKHLESEMFCNADDKYLHKIYELKTTKTVIGDLEKYYKALDGAIVRYHKLKMEEINMIVGNLWRQTYRGHDIDAVEIRSDEDPEGIAKSRRIFNYRVVMLKGDVEMDMRGRCSAGQKVLASIIIRLALAEAFCMNCGVFALDEPTTNLDKDNMESLAEALDNIIKSRTQQKNFQLVVITHQKKFVQHLGLSHQLDHFIQVYKDDDTGLSCLKKVKFQDL